MHDTWYGGKGREFILGREGEVAGEFGEESRLAHRGETNQAYTGITGTADIKTFAFWSTASLWEQLSLEGSHAEWPRSGSHTNGTGLRTELSIGKCDSW